MRTEGLRHLALKTRDLRATERFYVDVLMVRRLNLDGDGQADLAHLRGARRRGAMILQRLGRAYVPESVRPIRFSITWLTAEKSWVAQPLSIASS